MMLDKTMRAISLAAFALGLVAFAVAGWNAGTGTAQLAWMTGMAIMMSSVTLAVIAGRRVDSCE